MIPNLNPVKVQLNFKRKNQEILQIEKFKFVAIKSFTGKNERISQAGK